MGNWTCSGVVERSRSMHTAAPADSTERRDAFSTAGRGPGGPVVATEPRASCMVPVSSSATLSLSSVTLLCQPVNLEANVG